MERMVDRVAEHLDLDPVEVRMRNLIQPDEFPYQVGLMFRDGSPLTYDSGDYPLLLQGVLERSATSEAREEQGRLRETGSTAVSAWRCTSRAAASAPTRARKIRLTNSGEFLVTLAAAPQGQGYETVFAQIASDAIGVDMDHIRVTTGDTAGIAFGQGTFASRITSTAGPAVLEAGQAMREQVLAAASAVLDADVADLGFRGDAVCVVGEPSARSVPARDRAPLQRRPARHHAETRRAGSAGDDGVLHPGTRRLRQRCPCRHRGRRPGDRRGRRGLLRDRARLRLSDQPQFVDGQVLGGFAHGIGNALFEECFYDDSGQPQSTSYLDYALPSATEVPPVELHHVYSPSPLNPLGVKGAGEGGTIPPPATLANAIEDALRPFGARIT